MRRRSFGRGKIRGYLVVLALVSGVLAMHALTISHDPSRSPGPAATSGHLSVTEHAPDAGALTRVHHVDPAAPAAGARPDMSSVMTATTPCVGSCSDPAGHGGNHSATVMCLAVLGVLGVSAGFWFALASRQLERPDRPVPAPLGAGWWQTLLSASPRPYSLGVLRT